MKCPLTQNEIEEFLKNLKDDKFIEEFEKQAENKLEQPYEEMIKLSFKEFLNMVYNFEETDFGTELTNYNRDFIYQVCNDDCFFITFKAGVFEIQLKKPLTLADFKRIKNLVFSTNLNDVDDICNIQKTLPDFIEIKQNGILVKDVAKISYQDAKPLLFISPIIYYIFLFYINSIGGTRKKKKI